MTAKFLRANAVADLGWYILLDNSDKPVSGEFYQYCGKGAWRDAMGELEDAKPFETHDYVIGPLPYPKA